MGYFGVHVFSYGGRDLGVCDVTRIVTGSSLPGETFSSTVGQVDSVRIKQAAALHRSLGQPAQSDDPTP